MTWPAKMLNSLTRWVGELSPSCRAAARLQSEAMDHPLRLRQRLGLRLHLMLCRWCRRYGRQIGFLRRLAREQEPHEVTPPQVLRPEARERMKQRLRAGK
jgi:predicted anti-sigma-YlaC factor YlaD